jgi:creatinine amidohydrolase
LNGHGGNNEPTKRAMTSVHKETGAHFLIVDWWKIGFEIASEVWGVDPKQSGHGDLEEAALNISKDLGLADKEMYEKLGKDNVGRAGTDDGYYMLPSWATTRYPVEGEGYLDFDVEKAKEYTQKKSDHIADTFLEAVKRWQKMESWK